MSRYSSRWGRYVPVAERKNNSAKQISALKKKGVSLNPVVLEGRTIARTFWGKAWCDNLESYSDFSNRLPRGRTYLRNGSVMDLQVKQGQVKAMVMGSSLYQVEVNVTPMDDSKWKALVRSCAGKIDSLIELLQGKFSKAVMAILTEPQGGLFPKPKEIKMRCSCPDYAGMCKHIAAVLYGVGAALDTKPEWLFDLRHVSHLDLVARATAGGALFQSQESEHLVAESDLSALFGIELDGGKVAPKPQVATPKKAKQKASVKSPKLKLAAKKTVKKRKASNREMVTLVIVD